MTSTTDAALRAVLHDLREADYAFVTPTPATRRRYVAGRRDDQARDVRDIFGWGLPFATDRFDAWAVRLRAANALRVGDHGHVSSTLRAGSLGDRVFLHGGLADEDADPVFFGPDSYRFASLIAEELAGADPNRIVDVGTGSGVGAIVAAGLCPGASIAITDPNPDALRLARANAAHAAVDPEILQGDGVASVQGSFDVALLNPPYIADSAGLRYRDGGEDHGAALAIRLAGEIIERLSPGGRLILYTGSAIVDGRDRQREALAAIPGAILRYREIDPDVFGEMLNSEAYAGVERIAAVAAVLTKDG